MRKLVLALVILAFTLPATAHAAVKPLKPPKPAACLRFPDHPRCQLLHPAQQLAPVYLVRNGDELELHGSNLEPGSALKAVFEVRIGDEPRYWLGASFSTTVRSDGSYVIFVSMGDLLDPGHTYEVEDIEEVYAWFYDRDYWTPVTNRDGVPMKAEIEFET